MESKTKTRSEKAETKQSAAASAKAAMAGGVPTPSSVSGARPARVHTSLAVQERSKEEWSGGQEVGAADAFSGIEVRGQDGSLLPLSELPKVPFRQLRHQSHLPALLYGHTAREAGDRDAILRHLAQEFRFTDANDSLGMRFDEAAVRECCRILGFRFWREHAVRGVDPMYLDKAQRATAGATEEAVKPNIEAELRALSTSEGIHIAALLGALPMPVLLVGTTENGLILPKHTVNLSHARQRAGAWIVSNHGSSAKDVARQFEEWFKEPRNLMPTYTAWLRSGHRVFEERIGFMSHVLHCLGLGQWTPPPHLPDPRKSMMWTIDTSKRVMQQSRTKRIATATATLEDTLDHTSHWQSQGGPEGEEAEDGTGLLQDSVTTAPSKDLEIDTQKLATAPSSHLAKPKDTGMTGFKAYLSKVTAEVEERKRAAAATEKMKEELEKRGLSTEGPDDVLLARLEDALEEEIAEAQRRR